MPFDEVPDDVTAPLRAAQSDQGAKRLATLELVCSRYIARDQDEKLLNNVDFLINGLLMRADPKLSNFANNRREARALVVVGESGAGKSAACRRIFGRHEAFPGYGVVGSNCPLASISVPSPCTLKQLGRKILQTLGYPLKSNPDRHIVWEMVRDRLQLLRVSLLHLDEFQNISETANVDETTIILDTLKDLMINAQHPVALILSGLPSLTPFIERDMQVRRRARFVSFQPLTAFDIPMIVDALVDFTKVAELKLELPDTNKFVPQIMHAGLHQLGTVVEIMREAIEQALLMEDASLTAVHFADVYAERTGSAAPANPFLEAQYDVIDCSRVLMESNKAPQTKEEFPKAKPPRRIRQRRNKD